MIFNSDASNIGIIDGNSGAVDSITDATPPVITCSNALSNGHVPGAIVYLSGLTEATELNGGWYKIKSSPAPVITAPSSFAIENMDGTDIDGLVAAETSALGTSQRPVNLILPYCDGEMFRSDGSFIPKLVQSNDVIYMTHPDYGTRIIKRLSATSWDIAIADFDNGPYLDQNGAAIIPSYEQQVFSITRNFWGNLGRKLAVDKRNSAYLRPEHGEMKIISITQEAVTATTPLITTIDAHGLSTGDSASFAGFGDKGNLMSELIGQSALITVQSDTTFSIDIDTRNTTAYVYTDATDEMGAYPRFNWRFKVDTDSFVRTDCKYEGLYNFIDPLDPAILDVRYLPTMGADDPLVNGDKVTLTSMTGMTQLSNRTFTLANGAYKDREINNILKPSPVTIVTTLDHGLDVGDIIYINGIVEAPSSNEFESLNGKEFEVKTVSTSTSFRIMDLDGNDVDGTAWTSLSTYTANSGDASTSQFELTDPCTGVNLDATGFSPRSTTGSVRRGEVNRALQIRFENKRAETVWLWGRISHFYNSKEVTWTIDTDQKTPINEWVYSNRGDFRSNKLFPTGPAGVANLRDDSLSGTEEYDHERGTDWELGVYSDTTGFPSVCTIHQGRVIVGSSTNYPRRIDGTISGGFDTTSLDFSPFEKNGESNDSSALSLDASSADGANIQWLSSVGAAIMVGNVTSEGAILSGDAGSGGTITPGNASYVRQSTQGSSTTQPIVIGKSLLHVQKAKRRMHELRYQLEQDGYDSLELTELAEHITRTGIIDIAWQQNPVDTLWCVLDNGTLIGLTYERTADVIAWHKHNLGGTGVSIDSIAVIPNPTLERDQLWLSVSRTVDGQTIRRIEVMDRFYENDLGIRGAYHQDAGKKWLAGTINLGGIVAPQAAITSITQANPAVATSISHPFSTGDTITIHESGTMTEVQDKTFKVTSLTANTFSLQDTDGNNIDSTAYTSFTTNGWARYIKVTRSTHNLLNGDVIRFGNDLAYGTTQTMEGLEEEYFIVANKTTNDFHITYMNGKHIDAMSGEIDANSGTYQKCENRFYGLQHLVGENVETYLDGAPGGVTRVDRLGSVLIGTPVDQVITGISRATPGVVTIVGHGYSNGDRIEITGMDESRYTTLMELNDRFFLVASSTIDTFQLTELQGGTAIDTSAMALFYAGAGNPVARIRNTDKWGGNVTIGLPTDWYMETLPIEGGSATGTSLGKKKRSERVRMRLMDTLGLKYGNASGNVDEHVFDNLLSGSSAPELYTGYIDGIFQGGYDRELVIRLEGDGPYPCQIQSILPSANTQDDS
jgi:hypothetical protein